MSNIYIAGRVAEGKGTIAKLADRLETRSHSITYKWWELPQPKKPFLSHRQLSEKLAKEMVEAVKNADIFILFTEDSILGAATEFGIAIADTSRDRKIYIIHPPANRQSIFYTYPSVEVLENIEDIKKLEWY